MSDPFVAEIRVVGFNFPPKGWAYCNGQLLPISQNTALFSLLGTFYGGDGKSTFALPDLQGRVPMEQGQSPGTSDRFLGEAAGTEAITLLQSEMPVHNHTLARSSQAALARQPKDQNFALATGIGLYGTNAGATTNLNFQATSVSGSSLPHNNMMRFLTLNFVIALQGVFPPRS
jgi:microcystin-dependent protein